MRDFYNLCKLAIIVHKNASGYFCLQIPQLKEITPNKTAVIGILTFSTLIRVIWHNFQPCHRSLEEYHVTIRRDAIRVQNRCCRVVIHR